MGGTTDQEALFMSAAFHAMGGKPPGAGGLDWLQRHLGETKSRRQLHQWFTHARSPTRADPPHPPVGFSEPAWIAMLRFAKADDGSHAVRSLL